MAFRNNRADFRQISVPNPDNFEVMAAIGNIRGHARKMAVVSVYIPPGYNVKREKECLEYITDIVIEIKRQYTDPYITVMGDTNQWDIAGALENFLDIQEAHCLNTRGSRSIDRIFLNFEENLQSFHM